MNDIRRQLQDRFERYAKKHGFYHAAHIITRIAIVRNVLVRPDTLMCVDCGINRAYCYDHRDYSRPLFVVPVCRQCNARRGSGLWRYENPSKPAPIKGFNLSIPIFTAISHCEMPTHLVGQSLTKEFHNVKRAFHIVKR